MSMITRLMKCSIPIAIIKGEVVMKKMELQHLKKDIKEESKTENIKKARLH